MKEKTIRNKIGLVGPLTNGNLGNAAFEAAVVQHVRDYFPDAEIYGCCVDSLQTLKSYNFQLFPLNKDVDPTAWTRVTIRAAAKPSPAPRPNSRLRGALLKIPYLKKFVWALRNSVAATQNFCRELLFWLTSYQFARGFRLLIVRGGGQLSDTWGGSWNHPYALLKWATLARLAGTRFVILSVGADPTTSQLTRWMLKRVLHSANYHSLRDQSSRKIVEGWGRFDNLHVFPDLAFSLKTPSVQGVRSVAAPVIGVSPMAYCDPRVWPVKDAAIYRGYVRTLASFVSDLIARGYTIVLFASQIRADPPALADLKELVVREKKDAETAGKLREIDLRTVDDFVRFAPTVDFVVASRLHGLLLAQLMYTPALAISYDHKVDSLMESLGLSEFCLDIHAIDVSYLIERLTALESKREAVRQTLRQRVSTYREALDRQYEAALRF